MPRPKMPLTRRLLLALAALLPAAIAARPVCAQTSSQERDTIVVFDCTFDEETWDINYDAWPDAWRRHEDAEHPRYVRMALVDASDAPAGRALRIGLDGARARVFTPPMRVASRFSYQAEVQLMTKHLVHSKVIVAIDFLDRQGQTLQSVAADPINATDDWTTVRIQAVRPASSKTDRAVIRVETERGLRGDITGVVCIGSVKVTRLPSMDVTTNSPFNIYTDPRDVVVTCSLSGIGEQNPLIRFRLLDATSAPLEAEIGEKQLDGKPIGKVIHQESRQASDIIHGSSVHRVGYEGSTQWRPPLEKFSYGFFHVRVEMVGRRSQKIEDWREITLAIVPERGKLPPGEFGWTLPTADEPLSFLTLQELLPQAGVSWMKMPVWYDVNDPGRGEEILKFVEQLSTNNIEAIGVLEAPDGALRREIGEQAESDIAALLAAPAKLWQPAFDHLMTRLSLRIRWWQLGFDHDTSFVGYDDLVNKIDAIRKQLFRFGQDVQVGLGWRWDTPPAAGQLSWDFEQMSSLPPLNAEQLYGKLIDPANSAAEQWVLVEPTINESQHATERERLDARIREMISQIVVAKWFGVRKIFVANPFSADPRTGKGGLMCTNGTPGDLFLPWRTTATHLSGANYIGSLNLPGGSWNWIFRQGDSYLMVVWNDQPTDETLYLGDNVRMVNVWGQTTKPQEVTIDEDFHRQVIPVGPEPTFVLGVNGSVARWRMAVQLDRDRMPSVFAKEHSNALRSRNEFPQGVGGSLRIAVPTSRNGAVATTRFDSKTWQIYPDEREFSTPAGGAIHHPFSIKLNNAKFGPQPIRIDFDIAANRRHRFSVWRNMQVGTGQIDVDVQTFIDENGRLIVRQRMVNHTDRRRDFRCHLSAKGRRRKRVQVFQLGAEGSDKVYAYSNGEQLLGSELKLRLEEVNGSRVIVHKFIAEQ